VVLILPVRTKPDEVSVAEVRPPQKQLFVGLREHDKMNLNLVCVLIMCVRMPRCEDMGIFDQLVPYQSQSPVPP
jgi:hypothetical protein